MGNNCLARVSSFTVIRNAIPQKSVEFPVSMKFEHRLSFDLGELRRGSGFFSKITFLKLVHFKEKDEASQWVRLVHK